MAKPILMAEDSEDDAVLLRHALEVAGVRNPVHSVADGAEVVAYLKGEGPYSDREKFPLPGILLLDLKMPRMGGFQVMEWLLHQAEFKNLLVIILSGYNELKEVHLAYELGARSFLVKPCHPEDIRNLMRAYSSYWEGSDHLTEINADAAISRYHPDVAAGSSRPTGNRDFAP